MSDTFENENKHRQQEIKWIKRETKNDATAMREETIACLIYKINNPMLLLLGTVCARVCAPCLSAYAFFVCESIAEGMTMQVTDFFLSLRLKCSTFFVMPLT